MPRGALSIVPTFTMKDEFTFEPGPRYTYAMYEKIITCGLLNKSLLI